MLMRGPACFDFDLYRARSADLAALADQDALWGHFVRDGQFEGRVFRFASCHLLLLEAARAREDISAEGFTLISV